ncbi:MAG: hypothetical protein RI995_1293 [Bacteroidota bacterium]
MARETITEGLEPYTGPFGLAQKKHLLNRTMMALSSKHLADIENLSLSASLDLLFTKEAFPELPVNDYYFEISKEETEKQGYYFVPPGEQYHEAPEPNNSPWQRYTSFDIWLYKNMIRQKTSIHWRMLFFLHQLVPASQPNGIKIYFQHYELLFNSCFDSYKNFIYNMTRDPLMLDYLNLQASNKTKPDENYARELQELFTVGKGPNSKYTEDDVVEFARTLVGWRYDYDTKNKAGRVRTDFIMWNHDDGDKKFSAFYGNKTIKGIQGYDGYKELDQLLDIIFSTSECPLYICRRLYQFFCNPIIDATTEENIIKPMADILVKNNFVLTAPLKALLGSAHFFHQSNYNSLIKSPIEFMFKFYKEFDLALINYESPADIPEQYSSGITKDFYQYRSITWNMSNFGLNFPYPLNVSGWPAFYQAPVYDLFWLNSDTLAKRSDFANGFTRWGVWVGPGKTKGNVNLQIDWLKYIATFKNPENLDALFTEIENRIVGPVISEKSKTRIKTLVLGGFPSTYWTELYMAYKNKPSIDTQTPLVYRLQNLFASIFQLPEYHLF